MPCVLKLFLFCVALILIGVGNGNLLKYYYTIPWTEELGYASIGCKIDRDGTRTCTYLLYSVVLYSTVQQSKSNITIYIYLLSFLDGTGESVCKVFDIIIAHACIPEGQ